jgi:transposase
MTTKELAESLKVDVRTIQRIANELFDPSTVLSQVVNGGVSKVFTEKQAVAIKLKLRERNNLKDNSVVSQIGNDLEFFALLKKKEEL